MIWHKDSLDIRTRGKGMYAFTNAVNDAIQTWDILEGMCFLFIKHTSASLCISESYDPSAQDDLETFLDRLVPEKQIWHCHTLEGPDDSPSHMRAILTDTDLTIPIDNGKLSLGTWQGVYLFEHRTRPHLRQILIRCMHAS